MCPGDTAGPVILVPESELWFTPPRAQNQQQRRDSLKLPSICNVPESEAVTGGVPVGAGGEAGCCVVTRLVRPL